MCACVYIYISPSFFFFFFWPLCMACGILVAGPGIKPAPPAVEAQSLNPWTTREVPNPPFLTIDRYQEI